MSLKETGIRDNCVADKGESSGMRICSLNLGFCAISQQPSGTVDTNEVFY